MEGHKKEKSPVTGSRTRNAARIAAAGVLNRAIAQLVPFVLRTTLIKVLGEQYLGLSSLFASILHVLNLANLGFGAAIAYSMYRPAAEGDGEKICALLGLYRKIYRVIGLVILTAGLCLMPFLENFIRGGYPRGLNLRVLYLMYLFNAVFDYLFCIHRRALLSVFQQGYITFNINSAVQIVFDALKLILLFLFKNYYVYIMFVPLTTLVSETITVAISYKRFPQYVCRGKVDKATVRAIAKRTGALMLQRFGGALSTSFDSLVISGFLGLSALAVYSNYLYIAASLLALIEICVSATDVGLGNSLVTETVEKNYRAFKKLNLLNQWVVSWCAACMLCLYQHFMRMWVGEGLMAGNGFVLCMVLYFYAAETRRVAMTFKNAAGMWQADKWKPMAGGLANLAFNLISVRVIGMTGVILSTVVSYLLIELPWETYVLFRDYFTGRLRDYALDLLKYFGCAAAGSCASLAACRFIPGVGLVSFVVKGLAAFAISNGVFFALFHRREEFRELWHKVKQKFF